MRSKLQQEWVGILPDAAITARETVDADGNGQIDHIRMTAEGALNDDFSDINITVDSHTLAATPYVTEIGAGGALDDTFYVALVESGTPDTDATPTVTITANSNLQVGGNDIATDGGVAAADTAGPAILSKETADLDGNGFIDAIHVTFSEAIQDSTVTIGDWDVAGLTSEAFSSTINGDSANDDDIYITFADGALDTGATPDLTYTQGTLADSAGNLLASDSSDPWWNSQWLNRTKITFNNTSSATNLADFPVLIRLDSGNVDFSNIKAGGADIRFVDDDGTLLDYEIETWDDTAGSESANIWVRVQQVNANVNTDYIHLYYNNSSASDAQNAAGVWDANFAGVWHLGEIVVNEQTSGTHTDSTSNNNTGNQDGNDDTVGQIGRAQRFDGNDDLINAGNDNSLDVTNAVTLEAWVYMDTDPGKGDWFDVIGIDGKMSMYLGGDSDNKTELMAQFEIDGKDEDLWKIGDADIDPGAWNHIAITFDGTDIEGYINGSLDWSENVPGTIDTSNNDFIIGDWKDPTADPVDGNIDEVRVSSTNRSADWIEATWLSTVSGSSFTNFGGQEGVVDKAAPVVLSHDTADLDNDGFIDAIHLTFSEAIQTRPSLVPTGTSPVSAAKPSSGMPTSIPPMTPIFTSPSTTACSVPVQLRS